MLTIEALWTGIFIACFLVSAFLNGFNDFRDSSYASASTLAGIAALTFTLMENWTLVGRNLLNWLPPGDELLRLITVVLILGFGSFALLLACQFLLSLLGSFLRRVFYKKGDGHHV